MGVLTDLVVADISEIDAVRQSLCPIKTWVGVDAKGMDVAKVGTLWSILSGESHDGVVDQLAQGYDNSAGPWVSVVPERLVDNLAGVPESRFEEIALAWAQTEEFQFDGTEGALVNAREYLRGFCDVAKQAKAGGKSVLMWVCL